MIFSTPATRSGMEMYTSEKQTDKKNVRNHNNLTKRTSELHERAINSKKRSQCHLFLRRM